MLTALAKAERSTSYSGLRFPLHRPSRIGYAYCYTRFGFAYWTTLNVEVCGVSLTGSLTAVLRDLAIDTIFFTFPLPHSPRPGHPIRGPLAGFKRYFQGVLAFYPFLYSAEWRRARYCVVGGSTTAHISIRVGFEPTCKAHLTVPLRWPYLDLYSASYSWGTLVANPECLDSTPLSRC